MEPFAHFRVHLDGPHRPAQERLKGTFPEKFRHVQDAQRVSQVRLVGAELHHGLPIADHRIGRLRHRRALRGELLKDSRQHLFPCPEHILLGGKAHLEIQLIEFPGRTIRPGVLVPEAGRYLEIFVDARHHQQLLVLLGRLGQRVELPLESAGGDDVIPGPLRRRRAEDGGLYLHKAHVCHLPPQKGDHFGPEQDIVPHLGVAHIQIAVYEAHLFPGLFGCHHFKGKLPVHLSQHRDLPGLQLDGACGKLGVVGVGVALFHGPFHADASLLDQPF